MDEMSDYVCDIRVTVDGETLSDYDLLNKLIGLTPQAIRFSIDPGIVLVTPVARAEAATERINVQLYSTSINNSDWRCHSVVEQFAGTGEFTIDWIPPRNVEMWAPPLLGNTGSPDKVNVGWDPVLGFYIENRTADVINGVALLLLT